MIQDGGTAMWPLTSMAHTVAQEMLEVVVEVLGRSLETRGLRALDGRPSAVQPAMSATSEPSTTGPLLWRPSRSIIASQNGVAAQFRKADEKRKDL
jgi:hypothetical protein